MTKTAKNWAELARELDALADEFCHGASYASEAAHYLRLAAASARPPYRGAPYQINILKAAVLWPDLVPRLMPYIENFDPPVLRYPTFRAAKRAYHSMPAILPHGGEFLASGFDRRGG
jgi:hypothetical protein